MAGAIGGFDEALRVFPKREIVRGLPGGVHGVDLAVMHLVRRYQAGSGVVMISVVPVEERTAEGSGILDAAEAFAKARLVFRRLEVAFGEGIVTRRMRPVV